MAECLGRGEQELGSGEALARTLSLSSSHMCKNNRPPEGDRSPGFNTISVDFSGFQLILANFSFKNNILYMGNGWGVLRECLEYI